jgi:hypothetical protein
MGATTTYGWETPDLGDPANAPADFLTALQDVEDTVKDATILSYTPTWASGGSVQPSGATTNIGQYRVDNGVCHLQLNLVCGGSVSGGMGYLSLTAPLPASTAIRRQFMPCYIAGTGNGIYQGFAQVTSDSGTLIWIYFPASASDSRMDRWKNANEGGAVGNSVPLVPGGYLVIPGTELVISGSYYL